jgi:uncharacterized protein (TIGR00725 family)
MSVTRLPVVGVLGSGSVAHDERSRALGSWLARQDVHLLTGGGGGVMSAVSEAFSGVGDRRGLVIGILPAAEGAAAEPREGYPNPWVEVAVRTHLPLRGDAGAEPMSRNHINVLSSDVLVALPGGSGTASEVALALRYGRPVIAFLGSRDEIPGLPAEVQAEDDLERIEAFVGEWIGAAARSSNGGVPVE